jgi:ATP-dependent Lhr-like helicase
MVKKKLRNLPITLEETRRFKRLEQTADLFLVYKKEAAIALAARGVGPATATKILARFHKTQDDLLKDILEAERMYLKTKKYWRV